METLRNIWKVEELRKKLLFTFFMIFIYRIGAHITIPAIDLSALLGWFDAQKNAVLGFMDMFSGGALKNASIFAMGIMPYITASILLELMTVMVPYLEKLKKEGEQGRKKITQYTRYLTVVFCALQGYGVATLLESLQSPNGTPIVTDPGIAFRLLTMLTLVTGTLIIMWIGEQITERGIGNGISLIIYAGIIVGIPNAIVSLFLDVKNGNLNLIFLIILLIVMLAITGAVVFFEGGERRLPTQYARRVQGGVGGSGQSSYLPLKVNVSGVIPIIFAQALVMFPQTIGQMLPQYKFLTPVLTFFGYGMPGYVAAYIAAIIFFCFFYTSIIFNPVDTADNLKKYGAFVPGVRPGKATAEFIDTTLTRLTFWGGIYLSVVSIIPMVLMSGIHFEATPYIGKYLEWIPDWITNGMGMQFYFGGTSLLIVVGVAIDFVNQVESHLLMRHYDGIMKKGRVRGRR